MTRNGTRSFARELGVDCIEAIEEVLEATLGMDIQPIENLHGVVVGVL